MIRFSFLLLLSLGTAFSPALWATVEENPLQKLIDAAKPNAIIQPEPGTYTGSLTIDKPLTLDGQGKVTIDAGG
ncbi:MAG TPA: nitrous oxide reductase family maturation protein NosD, partial [Gammaproteobacteria bacterium]|nr:nitrous oxide reductase family maturation protein NosD [Gammaproteobacteria bacterium]